MILLFYNINNLKIKFYNSETIAFTIIYYNYNLPQIYLHKISLN
jgi:hypothetical protein